MHLSLRIFIASFLLAGAGMLLFLYSTYDQLRPVLRQASEEVLVDTANLLAEFVPSAVNPEQGNESRFFEAIQRYGERSLNARIWSRNKNEPNLIVYLTDQHGRVVFHTDSSQLGEDYSSWIDVSRTLRGEYGARTTRSDPEDETSSTMYVAAPVMRDGVLTGVLTVGQPNRNLQPFLEQARSRLFWLGGVILLSALLLGAMISIWLTRSIRRLVNYVEMVRDGRNAHPPVLREPELARLARSTERMRREIEGKRYVEEYVHTLAHEMKSPLSAVRGAVEILQESGLSKVDRHRFLDNIASESARMQRLIERLLSLASLENRQELVRVEPVDIKTLVEEELTAKSSVLQRKRIEVSMRTLGDSLIVGGERFLLVQAVSNLLDNAIDFCPPGGALTISLDQADQQVWLVFHNDGEPIPDYALPRLFERFYSLGRPDTGRKSTGLGLSFVHEIAQLHNGDVRLENDPEGGVRAVMRFPRFSLQSGIRPRA